MEKKGWFYWFKNYGSWSGIFIDYWYVKISWYLGYQLILLNWYNVYLTLSYICGDFFKIKYILISINKVTQTLKVLLPSVWIHKYSDSSNSELFKHYWNTLWLNDSWLSGKKNQLWRTTTWRGGITYFLPFLSLTKKTYKLNYIFVIMLQSTWYTWWKK